MSDHFDDVTERETFKELIELVSMVTGMEGDDINPEMDLFSFGLDSLSLMALGKQLTKTFSVDITLEELVTEYTSLIKIAEHIERNTAKSEPLIKQEMDALVEENEMVSNSSIENIDVKLLFDKQISVMKEQNEILKSMVNGIRSTPKTSRVSEKKAYVPYKPLKLNGSHDFSKKQLAYIRDLQSEYTTSTKASKDLTGEYRKVHAEWRNTTGFDANYKEFKYPIYASKGKGAYITDVDHNELIDVTMGFGVNLFGNNPEFVQDALRTAMDKNAGPLGPLEELPCIVAEKISHLTGNERVFFANTGTEADMFAVRLARAVTGKQKVIAFKGSYHGSYDGFLGVSFQDAKGHVTTLPMAPGITDNIVKDLVLLEYDEEESLSYIQEHVHEIAAVIVEPVQSRNPDLQPKDFMHRLRRITKEGNAALIFDEIILGFRIGIGGAQDYFGVKADIVTYGKVVGGGLPIGIIAGDAKFLDSIDGGEWTYGDNSVPSAKRTFVGGTFCHNNYTMTAANAVLDYIIEHKETMYTELNDKAQYLAGSLNSFFEKEDVSIRVAHFCSLFKFNVESEMDVFYYSLLKKGVYIWEGRTCYLSTEHSMKDVEKIILAVKETVLEMKEAGFFPLAKNSDDKIIPMSLIQERLYSQVLLNNGVDPFDLMGVFEVKGDLQLDLFMEILNKTVKQSEILRTSLHLKDGEFTQRIHDDVEIKLTEIFQEDKRSLQEFIDVCTNSFQLDQAPLMEVLLIHTFDKKKILAFHAHHTISDGLSFDIMVKQIVAGYNGDEWEVGKQYRDFVNWEKEYRNSTRLLTDQNFWRETMEGVTCAIPINSSLSVETQKDYAGHIIYEFIEPEVFEKLKSVAKEQGVSMFMLMFSLISLVIHKVTNEKSIALAVTASLRFASGFEDSLGMFANNIALKSEYDDAMDFCDYLSKIKKICGASFSHMNYPYNMLIKDMQEMDQEPLNITFSYENAELRTPAMDGISFEPVEYMPSTQDYDISFDLQEKKKGLEINFSYRTSLFREDEMRLLLDRYLLIINRMLDRRDLKLSEIDVVTTEERDKILTEFNNTATQYPHDKTIVDLLEEQVEKTPYHIALQYKDMKLTYEELNTRANQLARKLINHGVNKGDAVCLMSERSIETIVSIYAILKCGGAYMPVDPRFPQERIQYLLDDCQPKVVLLGHYDLPKDIQKTTLKIKDENLYTGDGTNLGVNIGPEDIAYLMYTSGTTGNPKGVISIHRGLANRIHWMQSMYPMIEGDVILQKTIFTFDVSVYEIMWSHLYGATLALLKPDSEMDVEELTNSIKEYGISHVLFVPTVLKELLYHIKEKKVGHELKTLKFVGSSGEALTAEIVGLFKEALDYEKCSLTNLYGPTEASIDVTYYNCNLKESNVIPIGKPIANTKIYILNGEKLCGIGWVGEICIGGVGVAKGYLNKPELTKEKFVKDPFSEGMLYKTGDLGYWKHDGNIVYCGRIDHQIKIRGQRVELGEIENAIDQLEGIKDAVVITRKDESNNEALYAYLLSDTQLKIKDVRENLRVKLPEYMIPQYIAQIDKIPLSHNGKVKRSELPLIEAGSGIQYISPMSQEEKILCEVFQNVLGIGQIGTAESFFDVGGDSIKAIKVVSKLREMELNLETKDILSGMVISDMAKLMAQSPGSSWEQGEVVGELEQNMKLSNLNHLVTIPIETGDEQVIRDVYQSLLRHHDILRARYEEGTLIIMPYEEVREQGFKRVQLKESSMYNEMATLNNEVQETMNQENQLLFRVVLYASDKKNYLTLCAHKAIVDKQSMNIIIEDLKSALLQKRNNETNKLPLKTASFIDYKKSLSDYASDTRIKEDKKYWDQVIESVVPYDVYDKEDHNLDLNGIEKMNLVIPREKTKLLLNEAQKAFNTNIKDFVLSALSQGVYQLSGLDKVTVMLESSGRNFLEGILDVERTVGNFTAYYPVSFNVRGKMEDMLVDTKETIRQIPKEGFNYGLLYEKEHLLSDILCRFNSEVESHRNQNHLKFNYTLEKKGLEFPIVLEVLIENDMINIEFYCLKNTELINFVTKLAKKMKVYLLELIEFCVHQEEEKKTVSDYGAMDMTEEELSEVLDLFS